LKEERFELRSEDTILLDGDQSCAMGQSSLPTLSIPRIPLPKAWLTIPYSGVFLVDISKVSPYDVGTHRNSMYASTDVNAVASGNSRSTRERSDGSDLSQPQRYISAAEDGPK